MPREEKEAGVSEFYVVTCSHLHVSTSVLTCVIASAFNCYSFDFGSLLQCSAFPLCVCVSTKHTQSEEAEDHNSEDQDQDQDPRPKTKTKTKTLDELFDLNGRNDKEMET